MRLAFSCLVGQVGNLRRVGNPPKNGVGNQPPRRIPSCPAVLRRLAYGVLLAILLVSLFPRLVTSASYDRQFRDFPSAAPSRQFPLGTDDLGRDRLARLLYGARISLLAAPAAALVSTIIAAAVGGLAGFLGGWADRLSAAAIDLMLSLPWLFLLIIVRAALPLNVPAAVSIPVTFGLIGVLGWASAARIVRAGCAGLRSSDLVIQARACGLPRLRVLTRHVVPNVRPILAAQLRASIPLYVLAEANLGLLGLGVSDPIPSWGNLLRPLESGLAPDWAAWTPLLLLLVVVSCLYVTQPSEVVVR
jgi:peptide/nickel transport system permease protein